MNLIGEENESDGAIAKWLCTGLQIRSQRFDSASRLHLFSSGKKIEAVPRAGVAQLVERNLAKVEVASSRLVSRSTKLLQITNIGFGRCVLSDAGVAQLVERNLAKVEVASSRLVSRSNFFVLPLQIPSSGRSDVFSCASFSVNPYAAARRQASVVFPRPKSAPVCVTIEPSNFSEKTRSIRDGGRRSDALRPLFCVNRTQKTRVDHDD